MISRRKFLVTSGGAAGLLALASCAPASPAAPASTAAPAVKKGGVLTVADTGDPVTLDPAFTDGPTGRRPGRAIFDPLVDVDPQGNLVPVLAESWENPDPTTFVLHLRKGVKFHDGTAFDAEAVKFHFDRHTGSNTKSRRASELAQVASTSVVDSSTIKISLKAPYSSFLTVLFDWSGFIASPTAVQKYGDNFGLNPVGTGPFKFAEYKSDVHTVVERNPDYWDSTRPYLESIVFRPIPDANTRLVELRSGGVQMAEGLPLQDVGRIAQMSDVVLSEKDGTSVNFLRWNAESTYGQSLEFRQALNWLIDRDQIHQGVYFGTSRAAYSPFMPGTPFYDENYKPFTRDVEKARQLVDAAQVPKPARFTLFLTPDPIGDKNAQIIQDVYKQIGVTVDIVSEDYAAYSSRFATGGDFLLVSFSGWFYRPDPAQYVRNVFHSQTTYFPKGKVADQQTDTLIGQGESESDLNKRVSVYSQLTARLNELAPFIFVHYGSDFKGLARNVQGFVHMLDQMPRYKDMSLG